MQTAYIDIYVVRAYVSSYVRLTSTYVCVETERKKASPRTATNGLSKAQHSRCLGGRRRRRPILLRTHQKQKKKTKSKAEGKKERYYI